MTIEGGIRLTNEQAYSLLLDFDSAFDPALHEELDLSGYCQKLAANANFVLAKEGEKTLGFIAYYMNDDGQFCYIPLLVVSKGYRRVGAGREMLNCLICILPQSYGSIRLEVLKNNDSAIKFYRDAGFSTIDETNNKWMLEKILI